MKSTALLPAIAAFAAASLVGAPAAAQTLHFETGKLVGPRAFAQRELGTSVAVHGSYAVVGSPHDWGATATTGAVYVYARGRAGWHEVARLIAHDGEAGDLFGSAVAIEENLLVVGAPGDATGCSQVGSAYVFRFEEGGWYEDAKLLPLNFTAGFGSAVAVHGRTVLVGAPDEPLPGPYSGAAYLFRRDAGTWVETRKLTAFDGLAGDRFGVSVALDRGHMVVGADCGLAEGGATGAAYVYSDTGEDWDLIQKLVPPEPEPRAFFGRSVAISGEVLVVGAWGSVPSGAAYVYRRGFPVWQLEQTLLPVADRYGSAFGLSVDVDGDTIVVGAPEAEGVRVRAGTIDSFVRIAGTWMPELHLMASDGAAGACLGMAVSLSGAQVVSGAPFDGVDAAGSAYLFEAGRAPVVYCAGKRNSLECTPEITACTCGGPSMSSPAPFYVGATDLLPDRAVTLVYSFEAEILPFHAGLLCVAGPRVAFWPMLADDTGFGTCTGVAQVDFNEWIRNGYDPMLAAGRTVYAQWWQRDPADPTGFGDSFTDALRFVIAP